MGAIWITGAGGAMGSALARALQPMGRPLVLTGQNSAALGRLAETLTVPAIICPGDLSEPGAASNALTDAVLEVGPVDGFVHCIGSSLTQSLHLTADEDLEQLVRFNYLSAAWALKAFVGLQIKQESRASAVLVGSQVAHAAVPNHEAIAASKAAVLALSESTAVSYANRGIRVNCIEPGLKSSALPAWSASSDEAIALELRSAPEGLGNEVRDFSAVVAFLLSDSAHWITGQRISVDNGRAVLHARPRR